MPERYDVCVIGLGPAGTTATRFASELGLRVLGIDARDPARAGLADGAIQRLALLRAAAAAAASPDADPLRSVRERVQHVTEMRTQALRDAGASTIEEGAASFVDSHTVSVGGARYRAKRILVCVGSRPAMPSIPGLHEVPFLTEDTLLSLQRVPESLLILGGGAIGAEMAQAFARLGARVTLVHRDGHLLPHGDPEAGEILDKAFREEGIAVYPRRALRRIDGDAQRIIARTDHGETLTGERLLVAAGRTVDLSGLALERAGVRHDATGIRVDRRLRTSARTVFAAGDCIGGGAAPHAAVHDGRIALLNALLPRPFARDARRALVPWVVLTDPPVAHVGRLERDLRAAGVEYELLEQRYEDDDTAVAVGATGGFVRAFVSSTGRIYGVRIIGPAAPEMIHEWALAMQGRTRIHRILLTPHAFPSISLLGPRAAERWAIRRLEHPLLRRLLGGRLGGGAGRRPDRPPKP